MTISSIHKRKSEMNTVHCIFLFFNLNLNEVAEAKFLNFMRCILLYSRVHPALPRSRNEKEWKLRSRLMHITRYICFFISYQTLLTSTSLYLSNTTDIYLSLLYHTQLISTSLYFTIHSWYLPLSIYSTIHNWYLPLSTLSNTTDIYPSLLYQI